MPLFVRFRCAREEDSTARLEGGFNGESSTCLFTFNNFSAESFLAKLFDDISTDGGSEIG